MDIFMQHDIQELSRVVSVCICNLVCIRILYMYSAILSVILFSFLQLLDNIESKMKGTSVEVSQIALVLHNVMGMEALVCA